MDTILIKEIACECIIGFEEWERQVRQKILVGLEIPYTWQEAAAQDTIRGAVDYKAISKGIVRLVGESQYNLIEALAESVANYCLKEFRLPWVTVQVFKPGALSNAKTVGVKIHREATGTAPKR